MDQEYGERYRTLYERHWWWRARTDYILETIRRCRPSDGSILDIGCGDGLFFDRLAEFGQVEGVEPCAQLVSQDNPSRGRIYVCPFDENFQPGKRYSLVLMLDVLEHLERPVEALKQAMNLLAPEGIFIATVPAFMALWTNHDALNHHFTRYTKRSLRAVAQKAGMRIREERYLYHWVCPIKIGVRVTENTLKLKPKPPVISNDFLNQFLYHLSRVEQKTLTRLPMPFGSSLLLVGSNNTPTNVE